MTESSLRVLLVDDQSLLRSGIRLILSVEDDIEVVGEAANGAEAVALAEQLRPDLVLMDVQMPVMDGIQATTQIVAAGTSKVVMLTTFDRDDYLFAALQAGASGFLLKNADPDDLVDAVRAVGHGHALLAPEVTLRVIAAAAASGQSSAIGRSSEAPGIPAPGSASPATAPRRDDPRLASLTEREREVLTLLAKGLTNAEIAAALFVGEATVKTHVSNVLMKLGVRDRVQAVVFAFEAGLNGYEG